MKYILMTVTIILILFTFIKKEADIHPLKPQDTILAFGDSLTYGYGTTPTKNYPFLLSSLTGLKVINAGVNGETSQEGLARLPKLLEDPSIKLMILCFGGNDILQKRSLSDLKKNLKTMIEMAKEKKTEVLLVSVPDISLFGLSALALYEEIADEEKVPLLSGILADILGTPSLKSDPIHPNASGYKQMAEKIYESLKKNGWVI